MRAFPHPHGNIFGGVIMRPVKRYGVNKFRSSGAFRRKAGRTNAVNLRGPMRGGIRL